MNEFDIILLWVLTGLALLNAVMRILLARRKGAPLSAFWCAELFIFPALLGISLVLYMTETADVIFPAVAFGLLEELLSIFLRRKQQKHKENP